MGKLSLFDRIQSFGFIVIIDGLDNFGSKWSSKRICAAIEEKDADLLSFISAIDQCGGIDILSSLCVIADALCDGERREWIRNQIKSCRWAECVYSLCERYENHIQKIYNDEKRLLGNRGEYLLRYGYTNFERFVWDNIDLQALYSLRKSDLSNIGIWFPGLFQLKPTEQYFKSLEKYAFPILCQMGDKISNSDVENKDVIAFVRFRIRSFLGELSAIHYSHIEHAIIKMLSLDYKELADPNCSVFADHLKQAVETEEQKLFYVTSSFTDYLERMYNHLVYFNDIQGNFAVASIRFFIPLFYALVGKDSDAYDKLIVQISTEKQGNLIRNEYLLVFFRCLLITQDENKRNHLISKFDEIYLNDSGVKSFLLLGEDIVQFYDSLSVRVRENRFDSRGLFEEDSADSTVKRWIKSGLLVEKLSAQLDVIRKSLDYRNLQLADSERAFKDFISLFFGLISHVDINPFINYERIRRIIDPSAPSYRFYEVYGIYSSEDNQQLIGFKNRLQQIWPYLPSENSILEYLAIKEKVAKHWKTDKESMLCNKLLSALREIQSNYFFIGKREDALNNVLASFLRGIYGEESVHREEPQGLSSSSNYQGKTDILLYERGYQFAIIEGIRLDSNDTASLSDHIIRLVQKYNTQGVEQTVLVIYAEGGKSTHFFDKIEGFLKAYSFPYRLSEPITRMEGQTANVCHHRAIYMVEGYPRSFHVFTVLLQSR